MRYKMEDGTVVDTENAIAQWEEASDWNGSNHISRATGNQWLHERLYRSRKGRYYLVHTSQWQGSRDHVEWVSRSDAAVWIVANDHDVPDDLSAEAADVTE